jgi:hypothetical protein
MTSSYCKSFIRFQKLKQIIIRIIMMRRVREISNLSQEIKISSVIRLNRTNLRFEKIVYFDSDDTEECVFILLLNWNAATFI